MSYVLNKKRYSEKMHLLQHPAWWFWVIYIFTKQKSRKMVQQLFIKDIKRVQNW